MDREEFRRRFGEAAGAARAHAQRFWSQALPERLRFVVLLNCSYDGHPLHADERVFPDDGCLARRLALRRCTLDETVALLWRDGLIPEWIDMAALRAERDTTVVEVLACGRFTANLERLYHQRAGNPPFHVLTTAAPVDLRVHERSWVLGVARCRSADDLRLAHAHASELRDLDVDVDRVGDPRLASRRFAWRFRRLTTLRLESRAELSLPDRWPRALRSLTISAPSVRGSSLPARLDSLSLHLGDADPDALARLLAGVASVRKLDLGGSPVDDALAEQLADRLSLHAFGLDDTRVTDEGLQRLHREHPVTRFHPAC